MLRKSKNLRAAWRHLGCVTLFSVAAMLATLCAPRLAQAATSSWILSDVAGTGVSGATSAGSATAVKLNGPIGLSFDSQGDLYIADRTNAEVDEVTPSGALTIVAGNGTSGVTASGSQATATSLTNPYDVVPDSAGNLYIADATQEKVFKVSPSGVITVFAGNGSNGTVTTGENAASAAIGTPEFVAVDPLGGVYIYTYESQIFKVNASGVVTVIAGTGTSGTPVAGPALSSPLAKVGGIGFDSAGDLFFADFSDGDIDEISPSGTLSIVAGTGTSGPAAAGPALAESLDYPTGLAVAPDGAIYASSQADNSIYRIDDGELSLGNPVNMGGAPTYGGPLGDSELDGPAGLAFSPAGSLYIADAGNHTVDVATPPAPVDVSVPTISGTPATGATLTATTGTWTGDEVTYAYQWQLCNASGADCTSIAGATSSSYVITAGDAGQSLRVEVTATNAGGSVTATSTYTTVPASASGGSGASTPGTVTLTKPGASFTVTPGWAVQLPLACPVGPAGCDANGLLTIALQQSHARRANAATATTVIARFEGQQIASGKTRLVKVSLTAAAINQLRARRVHRVLVTLTIDNHLNGGPAVETTEHLWLLVPSLGKQCLAPAGSVSASGVGQFRLGMARAKAGRLGRHVPRARVFQFYCVAAGPGIRIAYTTERLQAELTRAQRQRVGTGVILALTGNRHYSVRGITAGEKVSKARAVLDLGAGLTIGKNTWYVVNDGQAAWVFKVRHGIIGELGVANPALTSTLDQQRLFLTHLS